ncbi:hypothetical protein HBN50_01565 [Halobacteriovorax sp. GB3]|uniref:hypothetical protein n=1 Tax=Halobacteriovorax sp. GB3 TaxID=2719615 RepID=UPI00235EA446|nr:hypothetical protein [Halobacteriovorax sp. GB3]MDD0851757.1 hypothetical protein [Halobacteriovorax sp. GB3]
MRIILPTILTLLSFSAFAASTTVRPFEIEFVVQKDLDVQGSVKMSCRYEKIVFSDSSEYEATYEDHSLNVSTEPLDSQFKKVTLSLEQTKSMEVTGIFKPTKGCYSNLKLEFKSSLYAIGWANQFHRAIQFDLGTDYFYQEGDRSFDLSDFSNQYEMKEFSFFYKAVGNSQVNVFLYVDGKRDHEIFSKSAAIDPKTKMPYRLQ